MVCNVYECNAFVCVFGMTYVAYIPPSWVPHLVTRVNAHLCMLRNWSIQSKMIYIVWYNNILTEIFTRSSNIWLVHTPYIAVTGSSWWRHQMETFSALLAIGAGNSPVTGEFPIQRPVTRSFDVFFDLRLSKRLSKQSWGWWFETPSRPLWRHSNDIWFVMSSDSVTYIYIYIYIYINIYIYITRDTDLFVDSGVEQTDKSSPMKWFSGQSLCNSPRQPDGSPGNGNRYLWSELTGPFLDFLSLISFPNT